MGRTPTSRRFTVSEQPSPIKRTAMQFTSPALRSPDGGVGQFETHNIFTSLALDDSPTGANVADPDAVASAIPLRMKPTPLPPSPALDDFNTPTGDMATMLRSPPHQRQPSVASVASDLRHQRQSSVASTPSDMFRHQRQSSVASTPSEMIRHQRQASVASTMSAMSAVRHSPLLHQRLPSQSSLYSYDNATMSPYHADAAPRPLSSPMFGEVLPQLPPKTTVGSALAQHSRQISWDRNSASLLPMSYDYDSTDDERDLMTASSTQPFNQLTVVTDPPQSASRPMSIIRKPALSEDGSFIQRSRDAKVQFSEEQQIMVLDPDHGDDADIEFDDDEVFSMDDLHNDTHHLMYNTHHNASLDSHAIRHSMSSSPPSASSTRVNHWPALQPLNPDSYDRRFHSALGLIKQIWTDGLVKTAVSRRQQRRSEKQQRLQLRREQEQLQLKLQLSSAFSNNWLEHMTSTSRAIMEQQELDRQQALASLSSWCIDEINDGSCPIYIRNCRIRESSDGDSQCDAVISLSGDAHPFALDLLSVCDHSFFGET
ncbi:hypothetical protein DM01DRAFT_1348827 [Hesseltinella vesiculosa]|uniref:Uncharacterized protein n=1 Tax=Hesseltinella vesiculosa TaxID=101127 RepID=A0A1X2G7K8_9FUNG|nr:hypothetical protein DM01DRAFT_1348827 [Hesseltinella vesiculosa]